MNGLGFYEGLPIYIATKEFQRRVYMTKKTFEEVKKMAERR